MNIFPLINIAELGTDPKRVYEFGAAPANTPAPYMTWQLINLTPENTLSGPPTADRESIQLDVWAASATEAKSLSTQVRQALQGHGYFTSIRQSSPDNDTTLYRVSLDFSFIQEL